LLDVGCGGGGAARSIADAVAAREVHGVDVVDGCTSNIDFRVYDGKRLPYDDSSFDAVLVICVLHHATDPDELVGEISRVCRLGGKVLLVEDIASSKLQTWLTRLSDWYGNRVRNFRRALGGTLRWAMTRVPMTYEYRSYPEWHATFRRHGLHVVELLSIPHQIIEHGVFVLERREAVSDGRAGIPS
jgi:ubiquinone/menaquinone biosynthesis C-methylase UbiE